MPRTKVKPQLTLDSLIGDDYNTKVASALGIGDLFDFSYEEYEILLKEFMIKFDMMSSKGDMPDEFKEDHRVVKEEYLRIRTKIKEIKANDQKPVVQREARKVNTYEPSKKPSGSNIKVIPLKLIAPGVKSNITKTDDPSITKTGGTTESYVANDVKLISDDVKEIKDILFNQNKDIT